VRPLRRTWIAALAVVYPLLAAAGRGDAAGRERARAFLAGRAELGTTESLQLSAGWGLPFERWAGLRAAGWVDLKMATLALGGRVELQAVNLDLHWRATRRFTPALLPPLDRHRSLPHGDGETVHALEAGLWGGLPAPGGFVTYGGSLTRLLGLPGDLHVFDEGVHGVVRPPWSGLVSLGYVASLRRGAILAGGSADVAFLGRETPRARIGPTLSWRISPRLDLAGQLLFQVAGPDRLPLASSVGGGLVLGLRDAAGWRPAAR
jgi:hypothetical protein